MGARITAARYSVHSEADLAQQGLGTWRQAHRDRTDAVRVRRFRLFAKAADERAWDQRNARPRRSRPRESHSTSSPVPTSNHWPCWRLALARLTCGKLCRWSLAGFILVMTRTRATTALAVMAAEASADPPWRSLTVTITMATPAQASAREGALPVPVPPSPEVRAEVCVSPAPSLDSTVHDAIGLDAPALVVIAEHAAPGFSFRIPAAAGPYAPEGPPPHLVQLMLAH